MRVEPPKRRKPSAAVNRFRLIQFCNVSGLISSQCAALGTITNSPYSTVFVRSTVGIATATAFLRIAISPPWALLLLADRTIDLIGFCQVLSSQEVLT